MFLRSPLTLLVLAASVVPLSCSEGGDSDSATDDQGVGGGGLNLGSGGASSGGGTAVGGEAGASNGSGNQVCDSFVGLLQCGTDELKAEVTPVNILLVLDKSGSMDDAPEGTSTTLWDATTQALTASLASANDAVSFGLALYPERGARTCEMPEERDPDVLIAAGDETRELIVTELERTQPGGGTPTAEALKRAYQYFTKGEGLDLKGDRFVLLATDGGPNCNGDLTCAAEQCTVNIDGKCSTAGANCCSGSTNALNCLDDQETLGMIEDLRATGVDTFVVGLAGTEQYAEQLDAFAEAGGRPRAGTSEKYFRVEASGTASGLADVLDEITTQLVQTCDIQLTEDPEALDKINVAVDCQVISNAAPPNGEGMGGEPQNNNADSYWWLDQETSPPTVRLGGKVCRQIEREGVERIDIISGCATVR